MPALMKFRAITANCGNDVIGETACDKIAQQLTDEKLDFTVINCQEVSFAKAKKQLENALGKDSLYSVTLMGKMVTHTKPLEQLHNNTGLASFVIHKKNLKINVSECIEARRAVSRFAGSGFNKGGLITNFTVTRLKAGEIPVRMQAISGHLDSASTSKRTEDWGNIHQAMAKKQVNTWSELVYAMPNIRIAGYDANTRNRYVDEKTPPIKIWKLKTVPQELKAFQQAPLGGQHFSVASTYKTSKTDITTVQDPKRPGYVRGGMLDFVDIAADMKKRSSSKMTQKGVEVVGEDADSARDHDVIISPLQTYVQSGQRKSHEFYRVKNQMVAQLRACAPDVADTINKYTFKDRNQLIKIYNLYLSQDGLINKQIKLQADLLGNINKIIKINRNIGDQISGLLLTNTAWFSSSIEEVKTKQANQEVVSEALNACQTEQDLAVIQTALDAPTQRTDELKASFQGIIERLNANLLPDAQARCMAQLNVLIDKINSISSEPSRPEQRAGLVIQAAIDFTESLHTELDLLQQSNSPGISGACRLIQGMIDLVKTVVNSLSNLFVKEPSPVEKPAQAQEADQMIQRLKMNLSAWFEKLKLNSMISMASDGFSKLKEKANAQKPAIPTDEDRPSPFKR